MTEPQELLDVVDWETGEPTTGRVEQRKKCHDEGLPHRAVHVWVLDETRTRLLLQLRSREKRTYPSLWDISSAGHVPSGESTIESAQRELQEELGIPHDGRLVHLWSFRVRHRERTFEDREWVDCFVMVSSELEVSKCQLQESEVQAVRWMDKGDLQRAYASGDASLVPADAFLMGQFFSKLDERFPRTKGV